MAVHAQTNYTLTTKPAKTSLLGGHFIYRVDTTQGTLTPSSANIIQNAADNPQQWGYNTHIGANGIKLRYNETTLSEWKTDRLTFYKPGTNNPSLELISGINTALNIYNPTNNTKTLGLDTSGLNFYGTSASIPDVTLNADGLTLINGSIRGGIVGQDEFLYLSPQVFADEYEEYILSEDTEVDETKVYYTRSGEEGEYTYTEVSEPTGNPQENEYYEIAHAPGTIPIDDYVKDNWRQIIGRKFAVDTDGNLYANGLNANNANIEGAITATSLTIGSGSDAYDGAAAINISGYDIEIEKNGIDEVEGVSVYLYPILYHNGVQVPTIEVDYSHFIWYQDDDTIGTEGDGNNSGRYLATYGHNYRVIYDFDDGAVGGGTEVVDRTVDPSKYITKISDTGIVIHPEVWTNQSSYIQLDGTGMELFNSSGNSIAQYGSTVRVGPRNTDYIEINSSEMNVYSNNKKKIGINSSGVIGVYGGNGTYPLVEVAASAGANSGVKIAANANNDIEINTSGMIVHQNGNDVAFFGSTTRVGKSASNHISIDATNGIQIFTGTESDSTNVAQFGSSIRIGTKNNARFLVNATSLQAYDSSNNKYFEITNGGMSADLITSGKISSANNKVYFDLDNNEIACSKIISAKVWESTTATICPCMIDISYPTTPYGGRFEAYATISNPDYSSYAIMIKPYSGQYPSSITCATQLDIKHTMTNNNDVQVSLADSGVGIFGGGTYANFSATSTSTSIGTNSSNSLYIMGAVNFQGSLEGHGGAIVLYNNFQAKGTKSRRVDTDNYQERLLYCYETPTPMFGDIGEAVIGEDGYCYIDLDDIFSETIFDKGEYQVFLQKEGQGDCWIVEKKQRYFIIQGTPNLKIAWELKAKQKGYHNIRLEQAGLQLDEYEENIDEEIINFIEEQEDILYG